MQRRYPPPSCARTCACVCVCVSRVCVCVSRVCVCEVCRVCYSPLRQAASDRVCLRLLLMRLLDLTSNTPLITAELSSVSKHTHTHTHTHQTPNTHTHRERERGRERVRE